MLETHVKEMAASQTAALREWIVGLVHSPKYRVAGAQQATDYVAEHLRALSREASELVQALLPQLSPLKQTLLKRQERRPRLAAVSRLCLEPPAGGRPPVVPVFPPENRRTHAQRRVPAGRLHARTMSALGDQLRNLSGDLSRMAEEFGSPPTVGAAGPSADALEVVRAVAETIGPAQNGIDCRNGTHVWNKICTAWSRQRETTFPACLLPFCVARRGPCFIAC